MRCSEPGCSRHVQDWYTHKPRVIRLKEHGFLATVSPNISGGTFRWLWCIDKVNSYGHRVELCNGRTVTRWVAQHLAHTTMQRLHYLAGTL